MPKTIKNDKKSIKNVLKNIYERLLTACGKSCGVT